MVTYFSWANLKKLETFFVLFSEELTLKTQNYFFFFKKYKNEDTTLLTKGGDSDYPSKQIFPLLEGSSVAKEDIWRVLLATRINMQIGPDLWITALLAQSWCNRSLFHP